MIGHISPSFFLNMRNLRVLDITLNHLENLPSHLFVSQSRLKVLKLSNNRGFLTIQPNAFVGLTSMKFLRINHMNIKRISRNAFASLDLVSLDISATFVEQFDDNAFETLKAENILLNSSKISVMSTEAFQGIESVNLLVTDSVKFCCIKPYFLPADRCFPRENIISSCDDLLRHEVIRPFAWVIGL